MKILLTMNLPYTRVYGGANRSNRGLAEALAARHHSLRVVVPALAALSPITHQQLLEELLSEGIRVSSNGEIDVFNLNGVDVHAVIDPSRLCGYLVEQIREFKPDWTLVSSEDRSQSLLETALKVHPSRVIYLAHTPQMFPFGPASLYPGKRRTELIGQAIAVVTISRFVADYIQKWTGFESFIHHPPHYGSGPFPQCARVDNGYVLMMNACAVKGISIFLALARALPNLQFAALPGWGTTNAERTALDALPNVILLENRKNLDDILNRTRALLMPSLWVEGFGMAVVDAMLRGIPVLASNYGGLVEAKLGTDYLLPVHPIEHFEDYLDENMLPVPVVPKQDIGPWQHALSRLLSDRALHERQSAAAHDAALRFVSSLGVEPFEDFLLRLGTEPKASRHQFLATLKDQGTHGAESDTVRRSEGIADLTPEQQALLILRLRKNAVSRAKRGIAVQPIKPVSRDQELRLSFAQERLWFLDQLDPGSTVYNMPGAFRLSGPVDMGALERSLNEIVRRHEALRTTFRSVEGLPQQVIASTLTLPLTVIDLSELADSEGENEARRLAAEEARRPFDLSRGLLLRTTLLRLHEAEHILLLNMHHIVSDGWSMTIVFRELSVLYESYANGRASPLPELPIQYVDYAVWQREWLKGEVVETQLSYWKKQLENISTLQLPTDRPRPAVQSFRGARHPLVLSQDLTEKLRALSRKKGVTLFMTLLATFQTLLHRLTGQDHIVVGSPIAGRNRAEIERLIGFFINTLVLRTDVSGKPTFSEILGRVRGVCLDAYAHQDVPFEKLLEELRPERDLSRTPLFEVLFNMGNVPDRVVELSGLKIETLSHAEVESKFDLTLYVREQNGALQFNLVYNADLFNESRMVEMLKQYEKLLSQIFDHSDASIYSYSLLTEAAQELLPNPVEPLGSDWVGSVHERFSHQVKRQPDQLAITDHHDSWTYEELNSRSNQLAHYLIRSGIEREDIVAVYGHRSASLAWALLGILKAGAAFLILDPAYPTARTIQYLRTSKPRGFVQIQASGAIANELEGVLQATVHCRVALPRLSELGNFLEGYSTADPKIDVGPDDLAYVSYTSGSTGEPKGVLGRHGPLSHFLPWQAEKFGLTSSDHFSLLSGLSHDPLHREIFTALWVGGTICVPDPDILGASGELADWMASQQVTFAHMTPPLGRLLTETAKPESQLPSLRYAFLVGDKLTWADVARLRKLAPEVTCINYYGSTETQRAVSYYEIAANENNTSSQGVVPVGRGMPNVQLLVLNNDQKLAGLGEVGEIYMRSPHLARGYLNDESLTEARFITNPFTKQVGDRLYRTGDVGRYLRDGSVEILGRTDRQVKIRGFRIELGEIEAIISSHSDIREAVVLVREDKVGEIRLIAYAVSQLNKRLASHELRTFLKKKLPDYMIPSVMMMLDALPLTPNGKIDTRALPVPEASIELQETFVPPRTPVEEALTRIWAEVLSLDRVGVRHNFFELGGHSLLATKVMSRIRDSFQVELALRTLFEKPTVEELAIAIMERQAEGVQKEQVSRILAGVESLSEEETQRHVVEQDK